MADEDVPTYTEVDEGGFAAFLDSLPESQTSLLPLPLTHWPPWQTEIFRPINPNLYVDENPENSNRAAGDSRTTTTITTTNNSNKNSNAEVQFEPLSQRERDELYLIQTNTITSLFDAIRNKNDEAVRLLISKGWVSPDVSGERGLTPLIAAVDAGSGAMVCLLMELGARVDQCGRYEGTYRTPLMVAAALGRLALVKLLKDDFGADDGLIAPDGQLALRLAADAGHREVVDYLPSRRGGAFRRWQVHHHVAVRRIRAAGRGIYKFFKFFLYDVPRFFLWSVPKHVIVKPAGKFCKYCWKNKHRFGGWCKKQALLMPGRAKRAGKAVWEGAKKAPGAVWKVTKKVPKAVWDVAKEVPSVTKRVAKHVSKWIWRVVKGIPQAMKTVAAWIWDCLKRFGNATAEVFLKVVSLLHTAVMAVLDFFRSIKLQDIMNGVKAVLRAVFVGLPKALWDGILATGKMAAGVLLALFGCVGQLIIWLFQGLFWIATYVPAQLVVIIGSIADSMAKGYHEILVWLNPKH